VVEHVDAVLRDARGDEVELAPLGPELTEVADDGRVPEEALDLVDVEPGGDPRSKFAYMRLRTVSSTAMMPKARMFSERSLKSTLVTRFSKVTLEGWLKNESAPFT
jgi:hypothetical protein